MAGAQAPRRRPGHPPRRRALVAHPALRRITVASRTLETAWNYLREIRPALADWSARFDHLREVTRDDVLAVANTLSGSKRHHVVSVLRSLFRHCKTTGTIFRDPAARIPVGRHDYGVIIPLQLSEISDTLATALSPAARLAVALAGVHAMRPKAIWSMKLDDVDTGNRRMIVSGRVHPLDDLTLDVLLGWLDHRRRRWPSTANPHLIINQHTALDDRPVSRVWITDALRGQAATLERLRVDRQLEEALSYGPDPLHLVSVFGLDDKTASATPTRPGTSWKPRPNAMPSAGSRITEPRTEPMQRLRSGTQNPRPSSRSTVVAAWTTGW